MAAVRSPVKHGLQELEIVLDERKDPKYDEHVGELVVVERVENVFVAHDEVDGLAEVVHEGEKPYVGAPVQ